MMNLRLDQHLAWQIWGGEGGLKKRDDGLYTADGAAKSPPKNIADVACKLHKNL